MLAAAALKKQQFNTVFLMEMWERYAFYSFQTLFILFITHEKLPQDKAYSLFGIFTALLWMLPAVGGLLTDHIFGIKRSLLLGGLVFSLGYLILSFANTFEPIIVALSLIAIGNGFFKPMPATMLSKIYNNNAAESKAAFTLYYMSINIAGTAATLIAPLVALYFSYGWAFSFSVFGMLLGLANFIFRRRLFQDIHNAADLKPFSVTLLLKMLLTVLILFVFAEGLLHFLDISFYLTLAISLIVFAYLAALAKAGETASQRFKHYIGILLIVESIAFYVIYNQVFSTFILFAKSNVDLSVFGFKISPGNITILDGIGVLLFSPLIAKLYKSLAKQHIKITIATKFAIGQLFAGISVLVLALVSILFAHQNQLALGWLIVVFFIFTISEILVSALGLSMTALYFPQRIIGFAMGAWFLAAAVGGVLTGKFAQLFVAVPKTATAAQSLHLYIQYFIWLGVISVAIGIIYFIIARIVNRIAAQRSVTLS